MTLLTILGVTEILCSFKSVVEGKRGKEIPESSRLEFLEMFSPNNFVLSDAEDSPSEPLRYSRFTFAEDTISNSPKVSRAKFLRSNGIFCFISIWKFGSFKNSFATITSLSELYFRIRRFILLVQTKKGDFCELWQQHKQLKTMEMRETWADIFYEGYVPQVQPEPNHKIH